MAAEEGDWEVVSETRPHSDWVEKRKAHPKRGVRLNPPAAIMAFDVDSKMQELRTLMMEILRHDAWCSITQATVDKPVSHHCVTQDRIDKAVEEAVNQVNVELAPVFDELDERSLLSHHCMCSKEPAVVLRRTVRNKRTGETVHECLYR